MKWGRNSDRNAFIQQVLVFITACLMGGMTFANPVISNVAAGQVTIKQVPNSTVINQSSQKAILNWKSFNIGAKESTHFQQPTNGIALNRISPQMGASQIYGRLSATGKIILVNQAGIYFGPGSHVDVGGLIASTRDMSDANFLAGKFIFDKSSSGYNGSIVNQGTIHAAENGLVALVGNGVRNDGTIEAHAGKIILASGNKFTFDFSGDQLINFSVDEETKSAGVDHNGNKLTDGVKNTGALLADGGSVIVTARVARDVVDHAVNMEGVAQARSVSEKNGVIILDAGDGDVSVAAKLDASGKAKNATGGTVKILAKNVRVKNSAVIDASGYAGGGEVLIGGNYQGKGPERNAYSTKVDKGAQINADAIHHGNGGKIIAWSDHDTEFHGSVSAQGGAFGGNGGFVETSGKYLDVADTQVNLLAAKGSAGTWLLDPTDLHISSGSDSNVSVYGSTYTGDPDTASSTLNVTTLTNALAGANIIVQTGAGGTGGGFGDIYVDNDVSWSAATSLTLSAYRNIILGANITSTDAATVVLHTDNTGTGTGTISGAGVISTVGGTAKLYYNPVSFPTPTDYSANIGGTTTLKSYMLVNTATQLQDISTNLTGSYALGKDIDASDTINWNSGAGFLPIGTAGSQFSGNLDGLNHTIDSLYINRPTLGYAGLFGVANSGTINNVGVTNLYLYSGGDPGGNQGLGGIVGYFGGGTLDNVFVTGTIIQTPSALCGSCGQGGLVGVMINGTVLNSYNAASLTSPLFGVGGLVGSESDGTIRNSYNSGHIHAFFEAGGLVGGLGGATGGTIYNSYNIGEVTSDVSASGLVGHAFPNTIVENSYASGPVSGGVVSYGLIGTFDSGAIVNNSFWDIDTTGQSQSNSAGSTGAAGYRGMHTTDMLDVNNFKTGSSFISGTGWDITTTPSATSTPANTVWFMANGTRPILMAELFPADSSGLPTGAAPNPIHNAHQLQLMGSTMGGFYELARDTDLSGSFSNTADIWPSSTGFIPIGTDTLGFVGSFNGQNHIIDNLYINLPDLGYSGLFGFALTGSNTISNVGLTNVDITSGGTDHNALGAVVGWLFSGGLDNVFVTGSIVQTATSCSVCGAGGLVGILNGTIQNSYNEASITSTSFNVGGLVGTSNGSIDSSYNAGTVTAFGAGGIAGSLVFGGSISNSYNIGAVDGTFAGGLVGAATNGVITNSYATGAITGTGGNQGGLVAQAGTLTVNNSFWDTETTGQLTSDGSTGAAGYKGMTTQEMLVQDNFTKQANGFVTVDDAWGFDTSGVNAVWFNLSYGGNTSSAYTRPMLRSEFSTTIRNGHQLQLIGMDGSQAFTVANDIDLGSQILNPADIWGTSSTNGGNGFISVGTFLPDSSAFTGSLSGNGHAIDGLYINWDNSTAPPNSAASMFALTNTGSVIEDLGLTNVNITAIVDNHGPSPYAFWLGGTLQRSYATGTVTAIGVDQQVIPGGLVSGVTGGLITDSYSSVVVTATGTNPSIEFEVGGLAGRVIFGGTITNSYSTGYVTAPANTGFAGYDVGGLVGRDWGGSTFSNNYWDGATSGQSTTGGSSASIGCYGNTACGGGAVDLTHAASFTGWDFTNTWGIIEGTSYPYLKAFFPTTPRVVQGSFNGATGGQAVTVAADGVIKEVTHSGADSSFYSITANGDIADNSHLLIYAGGGAGNILELAASSGSSMTGLTNLLQYYINVDSTITSTSTSSLLDDFRGSLTSNDILFSGDASHFYLGNATNTQAYLVVPTATFTIDRPISELGSTLGVLIFGPTIFDVSGTAAVNVTQQSYSNVTLNADTTLINNFVFGSGISIGGSVTGGAHSLTLDDSRRSSLYGPVTGVTTLQTNAVDLIDGNVTTTGAQTYGATRLFANALLTGTDITIGSLTGNAFNLTIANSGQATSGAISGVNDFDTNAISLSGNVTTTGHQIYNNAVTFSAGAPVLDAGTSDITFNGTVDVTGTGTGFSATTTGAVTFNGDVGDSFNLDSFSVTASNTNINNDISLNTINSQTYNSPVTLGGLTLGSTIFTSTNGDITFASTIDGPKAVQISIAGGAVQLNGAVGSIDPLTSLAVTGNLDIEAPSITTINAQNYFSPVVFGQALTLTAGTDIIFASTLDSFNSLTAQNLTSSSGITFNGAVGSINPLGIISIANAVVNSNITTTGDQTYNGSVSLTGSGLQVFDAGSGAITFNDILDVTGIGTPGFNATTTGDVTFRGNVGDSGNLALLDVTANNTNVNNDISITTINDQTYHSPITLGGLSGGFTVFTSTNGNLTFADTIDGFFKSASMSAANGTVQFNGALGSINQLYIFAVTGNLIDIEAPSVSTIKAQDYFGATVFGQALTLTAGNGVTFHNTLDSLTTTPQDLTSASNVTFDGAVGSINPLGIISLADTVINSDVTTLGDQTYGAVSLNSGAPVFGAGIGAITFNGALDVTGTGTGFSATTAGAVTFYSDVGTSGNLDTFDITASNTNVNNSISITTINDQSYHSPVTLGGVSETFTSTNGFVTFYDKLDGLANTATISASNGGVIFTDAVGSINPLLSLSVTGGVIDIAGSSMSTINQQDYFGATRLASSPTFTAGTGITFHDTLDTFPLLSAKSITTTSDITFDGAVGGTRALGTISAGNAFINANVTTTGNQSYSGDVAVTSNPVLIANDLQFSGNLTGDTISNLTLNVTGTNSYLTGTATNISEIIFAGTGTFSMNNVSALSSLAGGVTISSGGTLSLNNLTSNAALTLNGGTLLTTGTTQLDGLVTLNASSIIKTTSLSDALTITGAIDGAAGLNLQGPGSIDLVGDIGGVTPLTSLTSSAGNLTVGSAGIHTVGSQTYISNLTLGADALLLSDSGNINFQSSMVGGNHNLTVTGSNLSFGSTALSGFNNIVLNGTGVNNSLTILTNDPQTWQITGSDLGAINSMVGVNSLQFNNIQNLVGGSGANNFVLNGGTVSGSITGGSGTQNVLTIASGPANWTISGADSGGATGVGGGFSQIQYLTGGSGTSTFTFTGTGSITGQVDGGNTTSINIVNFTGYAAPVKLTLSMPAPGSNELNAGTILNSNGVRITSFNRIQKSIGSGQDTITLPAKSNLTITYPDPNDHSFGYIGDPFYFQNMTITNPPAPAPVPEPTPAPTPAVINGDVAQIITPFSTTNSGTGPSDPISLLSNIIIPTGFVDIAITNIIEQETSLDDDIKDKQTVGCY